MSGTREAVRRGTAPAHAAIERVVPLGRPDLDLPTYRAHLERMFGVVAPLEARLQEVPGLGALVPDLATRWRATALATDLVALGVNPAAVPLCASLPALPDADAALGSLYVLEGSRLGGRQLSRGLRQRLPAAAGALRWLDSDRAQLGASWRGLLDVLDPRPAAPVVQGARDTFACLQRWLEREGTR